MKLVSIVIPLYNEAENVTNLVEAIEKALVDASFNFEVLLVDDGSRDSTAETASALVATRPWLRCMSLVRNYGQSTALQAGFDHAEGVYIVTLDGDLQNDPKDIPLLVQILDDHGEIDCVSGWRKERRDAVFSRKIPSYIANWLISAVTGVRLHDYGCALKIYRKEIIVNLRLYGELHRFVPVLAAEAGARILEVPVLHHPRMAGRSKYGVDRTIRVLLDLLWIRFLMRFLHRPIHLFGSLGLALLVLGVAILSYLVYEKLVFHGDIGGRPLLLLSVVIILIGIQFLVAGLLGELLTRIYHEPKGRLQYLIRRT